MWRESNGNWRVRLRGQPARTDVVLDLADTGIVRMEATLHPAPQLNQMPLHVDIDWRQAQLGQLSRLVLSSDQGWRGDMTGELHLDGTAASARIESRLRASGVHRAEFAPAAPLDFDATCSFIVQFGHRSVENLVCKSPVGREALGSQAIFLRKRNRVSRWSWIESPRRQAWTFCAPCAATSISACKQRDPSAGT